MVGTDQIVPTLILAVLASGCSGTTGTNPGLPGACDDGSPLPGGSCLVFDDGGRLDAVREDVDREVSRTVEAVRGLLPIDGVTIRVLAGTALVIPEIGMGGRAQANEVRLAIDAEAEDLDSRLASELFPLLAHELHHVARQRTVGYGADLLGALVSEGLADHFSIEMAGIDPPLWSSALAGEELQEWAARAELEWYDTGYDHRAWFVGASPEIPRWAGYSIGFAIVRAHLEADPTRRPSTLHDEPAGAFVTD